MVQASAIHPDEPATKLPVFPRVFLWATSVISAWALICSALVLSLLSFSIIPETLSSHAATPGDLILLISVTVLIIVQTVFLFVWLRSSTRLLKLNGSGLRTFRVCLIVINVYLILVALGQLASVPVFDTTAFPFLWQVIAVSTIVAVGVLLLSIRMFHHLKSQSVQQLLSNRPNRRVPADPDPRVARSGPLNSNR